MDDDTPATLADRVKLLRDRSGIDQAALSTLCGLSQGHLGQIIRGELTRLRADTLTAISQVTGASIDWLLTGKGHAPGASRIKASVERAQAERAA